MLLGFIPVLLERDQNKCSFSGYRVASPIDHSPNERERAPYQSQIYLNRVKPRDAIFDDGTALRRIQIDLEAVSVLLMMVTFA